MNDCASCLPLFSCFFFLLIMNSARQTHKNVRFRREVGLDDAVADLFPILNEVVTVENIKMYKSMVFRFWKIMDSMDDDLKLYYMARAEQRYEKFVGSFVTITATGCVPPIDVAMFWHAHLLSPFRYCEDIVLRHPASRALFTHEFPLADLFESLDSVSEWQHKLWAVRVPDEPYNLFDEVQSAKRRDFTLQCGKCNTAMTIPWEEYVQMRHHNMTCPIQHKCSASDSTNLNEQALYRLERDIKRGTVAGTLLDKTGQERQQANVFVERLAALAGFVEQQNEFDLEYKKVIEGLLGGLGREHLHDAQEIMFAIQTCYKSNASSMFSLDLWHAVLRQRALYTSLPFLYFDFTSKTRPLLWDFTSTYRHAIRRYHDFLCLMVDCPDLQGVPTIEIDYAWHTHMLFAARYRDFCLRYMNRVINHDDAINELNVDEHSKKTDAMWSKSKMRYMISVRDLQRDIIRLNCISDASGSF
ncbi:hypothetical protein BC940DRAFT_82856 [Gongronella butleri]|nr:hypothetical protein BC940DRAFT_82856 [Gongronella butleri]